LSAAGEFRPPNKIGEMLVSSRSLAEYRAFFALTDENLAGTVLDCPGGAASFTAEVSAAGGNVVACDPIYARPLAELLDRSRNDLRRAYRYQRNHPEEYIWTFFADSDHYRSSRARSLELFAAHRASDSGCYVAASLPALPFPDRTFDLALSSHLLFAYADRLDREFHVASVLELARVATEVRISPLVPFGMPTNPDLDGIRAELAAAGLSTTVTRVDYELQRGANAMMVTGTPAPGSARGTS
jgi:SAM-dependent methyltransferase